MFNNSITNEILQKTNRIRSEPEITPAPAGFSMFNTGGVEVEVGEFLYSLVRMIKPGFIVETGTHLGISSLYMALGCRDNAKGSIWTYEVIPSLQKDARALWNDIGVQSFINSLLQPSLNAVIPSNLPIDLLFLDSEPQYRFDEFLKFWDQVSPGGLILVHDLHPSLGHHGQTHHGVYDWPYGDFRTKIGSFIKEHKIQTVSFPTPRGLTIFQKEAPHFEFTKYLRS
jgi:predicted O-methyltransferase YrrM